MGNVCVSRDNSKQDDLQSLELCSQLRGEVLVRLQNDLSLRVECENMFDEACQRTGSSHLSGEQWRELISSNVDRLVCDTQWRKERLFRAVAAQSPENMLLDKEAFTSWTRNLLILAEQDLTERIAKFREKLMTPGRTPSSLPSPEPLDQGTGLFGSLELAFRSDPGPVVRMPSHSQRNAPGWDEPRKTLRNGSHHTLQPMASPSPFFQAMPQSSWACGTPSDIQKSMDATALSTSSPRFQMSTEPFSDTPRKIFPPCQTQFTDGGLCSPAAPAPFQQNGVAHPRTSSFPSAPHALQRAQPVAVVPVVPHSLPRRDPVAAAPVVPRSLPRRDPVAAVPVGPRSFPMTETAAAVPVGPRSFPMTEPAGAVPVVPRSFPSRQIGPPFQVSRAKSAPLADTYDADLLVAMKNDIQCGNLRIHVFNNRLEKVVKRLALNKSTGRISLLRDDGLCDESWKISDLICIIKGISHSLMPDPPPHEISAAFRFRIMAEESTSPGCDPEEDLHLCVEFNCADAAFHALQAFHELCGVPIEVRKGES